MRAALAAVAIVLLAAAGCAGQPADPDAAVEAMLLETCAPDGDPAADPVCRCAYEALLDELGADELARLDAIVRHDLDALPAEARRLVLDCAFDIVAPDVPPVPTTAPTTTTTERDAADTTTTTERG